MSSASGTETFDIAQRRLAAAHRGNAFLEAAIMCLADAETYQRDENEAAYKACRNLADRMRSEATKQNRASVA